MGLWVRPLFPAQSACSTHTAQAAQPHSEAMGLPKLVFHTAIEPFPWLGVPTGAEVPGAEGQPQTRVPMGQAGLGVQPQGSRDTPPSPHPVIQPNQAIAPCLTTEELNPHCRRETKHGTETAVAVHQPRVPVVLHRPLSTPLTPQVGCKHTATGREPSITCVTLPRPGRHMLLLHPQVWQPHTSPGYFPW